MKKFLQPRTFFIGAVLLGLLGIIIAGMLRDDPLRATLADGTELRILKWEVARESRHDPNPFWVHAKHWLATKTPLPKIWPALQASLDEPWVFREGDSSGRAALFIWFETKTPGKAANPARGAFIEESRHLVPPWADEYILLDEHGTCYRPAMRTTQCVVGFEANLLVFSSFNRASARFQLLVKDESDKTEQRHLRFTLNNPSAHPPAPASPHAAPLPVRQDLGECTLHLADLRLVFPHVNYPTWEPGFRIEKDGRPGGADYAVERWELSDPDGGCENNVSAQAAEWIVRGRVLAKKLEAIPGQKCARIQLAAPAPRTCQPVPFAGDQAGKYRVWLMGAGAALLDGTGVIRQAALSESEPLRQEFESLYSHQLQSKLLFSDSSRDTNAPAEKTRWGQFLRGNRPGTLFVEAVKPTLLILHDTAGVDGDTLFLANPAKNWRAMDASVEAGKWSVLELDWPDWDDTADPQTVELGLAEAMPFELRFIPTEEMRRQVPRVEWQ